MGESAAKCVIEIRFDRENLTYKPGERITGTVEILPGADMRCRKVTLTARWAARGKGPEDAADAETIYLPGGAWRNNEKVTHTFDFPAPRGPITYNGVLFKVGWQIRATADVHGSDATTSEDFTLLPGPSSENVRLGIRDGPPPQVRNSSDKTAWNYAGGCTQLFAILFGVVLLFVGLPCLILGLSNILAEHFPLALPISFPAGRFQSILLIGMGAFFTVLGCIALFIWIQAALARTRLGPVQVEVCPRTLGRGENVTCSVRLHPRGSIQLTEGTAILLATEHVESPKGNADAATAPTLKRVVHQSGISLATGRTVCGGADTLPTATFTIPPDAPCTFWGGSNKLIWTVTIELKLKGWPDWARTAPITIRP